jgi:hypothetical protein
MERSKRFNAGQKEAEYSQNKRFQKVEEKIKEEKTMSEFTILKRLQRVENFIGSFPCDAIPECSNFPSLFILNTSQSNSKGSHWFAVREDLTTIEVFDSLKLKNYPPEIEKYFLKKKTIRIRKLQSNKSFFCGLFSCYFIISRSCSSFKTVLKPFPRNLSQNDSIILQQLYTLW